MQIQPRAVGMEPFMELPGPGGAHRGGCGLPKTASRALSVGDRTVKTELDVMIDERSKRKHVIGLYFE